MKHLTALKKTVLWSVLNRPSATLNITFTLFTYCENILFKVTHLRYMKTHFVGVFGEKRSISKAI